MKSKEIIVGYGRKSKEDKDAKGISLDNQQSECSEFAKKENCHFVYFEDNNKSGDNLNRPNFKKMIEYLKSHKVKCIIVWKLDRITRNIEDYYGTIQPMLRKYNTTIASVTEGFYNVFKLEPMILAMYIGMAAQELKNTKVRTKSVMEYRATHGGFLGKAPVGYINTRDKEKRGIIIPDPDKKHYIKQAFDLYATGIVSLEGVGKELAKYGFIDSKGKPYSKKRIADILKNPVYMGKVFYNGVIYDGKHDAIVSEELFYRVQLRFDGKESRKPKGNVKTYSGFIKCAKCGCAYTGLLKHGAHNSGNYLYYHCTNYKKIHKEEYNVSESVLDEAMQEVLDSFNISEEQIKRLKKSIFSSITELQSYEYKSIEELQKQYKELTSTISIAVKKKLTGKLKLEDDTYNELIRQWQNEKNEIGNKIANLSESTKDTITRMNILVDFANHIPELYLKATLEEKRMILATITESIIIDGESEIITVKLRPAFEQLRQIKLHTKKEFSESLENLTGTLETRSVEAKEALKNGTLDLTNVTMIGTRKSRINTEIEPSYENSKKLNVVGGT